MHLSFISQNMHASKQTDLFFPIKPCFLSVQYHPIEGVQNFLNFGNQGVTMVMYKNKEVVYT